MQCSTEKGELDKRVYPAELRENNLYYLKCDLGHETVTCLQNQRFEVLFELAANAVLDGYYREAVLSFTSSLERFYEFYLQVISVKHGIPQEKYNKAWKEIKDKSERQLGAYINTYVLESGEPPALLPDKKSHFRNEVVHQGRIPTRDEAIEFGQEVRNLVAPAWTKLKEDHPEHVTEVVKRHVMKIRGAIRGDPRVQFQGISTTLSMSRGKGQPQPSLQDALNRLKMRRAIR